MQLAAATSRGAILLHDHWTPQPVKSVSTVHEGGFSSVCSSKTINIHTLFILLGETRYTSTSSIFLNSITFAFLFLFLKFDTHAAHPQRVNPRQRNLLMKLQHVCMLQRGSQKAELNYLHPEIQTKQGWIHLHNGLISSRETVSCHVQWPFWMQYMFICHPECMCTVCFMDVTGIAYCMLCISAASLLLQGLLRCHSCNVILI